MLGKLIQCLGSLHLDVVFLKLLLIVSSVTLSAGLRFSGMVQLRGVLSSIEVYSRRFGCFDWLHMASHLLLVDPPLPRCSKATLRPCQGRARLDS